MEKYAECGERYAPGKSPINLDKLAWPEPGLAAVDALVATTLHQEWTGKRYFELEGPRRYSQLDAADAFFRLLGKPMHAVSMPRDRWQTLFEPQGTPANRVAARIEILDGFNSGWIEFERDGSEHAHGIRILE